MNVDYIKSIIEAKPNLSTALGMEFVSTPEDDTCMAHMKVDERNRQPFGFLSGGASLALAENVAGVGSSALCPGCACVGIEVSGSHVQAVSEGDTVTAFARLQHRGNTILSNRKSNAGICTFSLALCPSMFSDRGRCH